MNLKSTDILENWRTLSDTHCTVNVLNCSFHWLPLYPTVSYCTYILNSTVSHWTPMYSPSNFHCTALNAIVHITDQHLNPLYATVLLIWKINRSKYFQYDIFFDLIFNYDIFNIYIVKILISRQNPFHKLYWYILTKQWYVL